MARFTAAPVAHLLLRRPGANTRPQEWGRVLDDEGGRPLRTGGRLCSPRLSANDGSMIALGGAAEVRLQLSHSELYPCPRVCQAIPATFPPVFRTLFTALACPLVDYREREARLATSRRHPAPPGCTLVRWRVFHNPASSQSFVVARFLLHIPLQYERWDGSPPVGLEHVAWSWRTYSR